MLKYLVIQLADSAPSYCHYPQPQGSSIIAEEDLRKALFFSQCENLNVQALVSCELLPQGIKDLLSTVDFSIIAPYDCRDEEMVSRADVIVFPDMKALSSADLQKERTYLLRTTLSELLEGEQTFKEALTNVARLNVVLTDEHKLSEAQLSEYKGFLEELADWAAGEILAGKTLATNILTDRITLKEMNNCQAGHESIALAPDGRYYACPGFYAEGEEWERMGDVNSGPQIPNQQLYRLDHAPICRLCDAYQCKRCVWLNRLTTLEVNTPGHEQCVAAHHERNASARLLSLLRERNPDFLPDSILTPTDCLDPFEKATKW